MSRRTGRPPGSSLYVRNVPDDARSEDLRTMFSKYGVVTDVYIPVDYYTRRPRGFAYVQFDDPRDAEDALYYMHHVRYYGIELEVEMARSDRKSPDSMRQMDGAGGRGRSSPSYGGRRGSGSRGGGSRGNGDRDWGDRDGGDGYYEEEYDRRRRERSFSPRRSRSPARRLGDVPPKGHRSRS